MWHLKKRLNSEFWNFVGELNFKNLNLGELDLKLEPQKIISRMETWKIEFKKKTKFR